MSKPPMDPWFRVRQVAATPSAQTVCWVAMHQDYCEDFVIATSDLPEEDKAGRICVKKLLAGERGHYGPLEHVQIVFNVGYFPHSVMQQARTHRIGVSFDVQSMRYTGQRIVDVVVGKREVEEVFYLRPVGSYADRSGGRYEYTEEQRSADLLWCRQAAERYALAVYDGMPEEQARATLPFDYRQHFVVSFTLRALMHFLDLRAKKDAQNEICQLCDLMVPHFRNWVPEIADWYMTNRYGKARLAP